MSVLRKIGVALASCAAVFLLLIAAAAAFLYYGFKTTDATVSPKIDSLFAAISDGTFADGYEVETTQEFRDVTTKEDYAAIAQAIKRRLGDLQSKSLQSFKLNQWNATSTLAVAYDAQFQKGKGTILATFEKRGDAWKILSFRVNSPLFESDLVCPKCGEACALSDRFCPSCGEPLPEEEEEKKQEEPNDGDFAAIAKLRTAHC